MSGTTFGDASEALSSATRSYRKQKCVLQPYTGVKRLRKLQPKGSEPPHQPKVNLLPRKRKVKLLPPQPKLPLVEYKCENCAIVFWQENTLQLHKQFCCAPSAEKPYNCEVCWFGFSRQDILLKHMETRHGLSLYRCETCGAAFRQKAILARHCLEKGHEIFKCEICGSAFLTADDLQNHTVTIHMTDSVKKTHSKLCGTVVPEGVLQQELLKQPGSSETLNISQEKYKVQKPETETVTLSAKLGFKCETCGIVFLREDILQKHVLARHASSHEPKYKCEECSAPFHRKTLLIKHMCVHHFECCECGKKFMKKVSLQKHLITFHTPDDKKPFQCEDCGNRFSSKRNLLGHAVVHLSERPFKCGICDRGFKTKDSLKVHVRIHTGDKPHKCTICGKAFLRSGRLDSHFALHSMGKINPTASRRNFK